MRHLLLAAAVGIALTGNPAERDNAACGNNGMVLYSSEHTDLTYIPPDYMYNTYFLLKEQGQTFERFEPAMEVSFAGKYEVAGDTLRLYPKWAVYNAEDRDCTYEPHEIYGKETREHYWEYLNQGDTLIDITRYIPYNMHEDSVWTDTTSVSRPNMYIRKMSL